MKIKYFKLVVFLLSLSFNAFSQELLSAEDTNQDYLYQHLGPWKITTLANDEGENFLLLDRKEWGAISMDSLLGNRSIVIQGKSPDLDTVQFIEVTDSNNDGQFDVIQISNDKPEFKNMELRFINGTWQMKTVLEWYESNKNN